MAPSKKERNTIDLDKILEHVGPLGLWQFWLLVMLSLISVIAGLSATTFAFTGEKNITIFLFINF